MARSISKNRIVRNIFTKLAPFYDQLEPALNRSQGSVWRQNAIAAANLHKPRIVLDGCSGTGLLTCALARALGPTCHVVGVDFCPAMVALAKQQIRQTNIRRRVEFKNENIEIMSFPDNFFDAVFMAFGMRFVSDIRAVLYESCRVLKDGAPLVILEQAVPPGEVMRWHTRMVREYWLPLRARMAHGIPAALYHPLHDSLIHYPNAKKFGRMMLQTGFSEASYKSLRHGVATIHRAIKRIPEEEKADSKIVYISAGAYQDKTKICVVK